MMVFDIEVADLTEELQDPIELLFGVQLGGGPAIHKALSYCAQISYGDNPRMRNMKINFQ